MRTILAAVAILAAGTGLSSAQDATTTSAVSAYTEVEDGAMMVTTFNLTVDDLDDMDIVGANGDEIGEVDDVLMNASGEIVAVSAEVGGFLGLGDTEVVFPLDQLTLQGDEFVTSLTKEQVEALEERVD